MARPLHLKLGLTAIFGGSLMTVLRDAGVDLDHAEATELPAGVDLVVSPSG